MSTLAFAALSGFVWMGLRGDLSLGGFAFGAVLGAMMARIEGARGRRFPSAARALRVVRCSVELFVVFLWELVVANVQQLRVVLAPRIDLQPGWLRFETRLERRATRAVLAAMISLIPGSLTYEESEGPDGVCVIGLHLLDVRTEAQQLAIERERS